MSTTENYNATKRIFAIHDIQKNIKKTCWYSEKDIVDIKRCIISKFKTSTKFFFFIMYFINFYFKKSFSGSST